MLRDQLRLLLCRHFFKSLIKKRQLLVLPLLHSSIFEAAGGLIKSFRTPELLYFVWHGITLVPLDDSDFSTSHAQFRKTKLDVVFSFALDCCSAAKKKEK